MKKILVGLTLIFLVISGSVLANPKTIVSKVNLFNTSKSPVIVVFEYSTNYVWGSLKTDKFGEYLIPANGMQTIGFLLTDSSNNPRYETFMGFFRIKQLKEFNNEKWIDHNFYKIYRTPEGTDEIGYAYSSEFDSWGYSLIINALPSNVFTISDNRQHVSYEVMDREAEKIFA